HQRLEVEWPHQIGLHSALGELPREQAGLTAAMVNDVAENGGAQRTLSRARWPGNQHVLFRKHRQPDLRQRVLTLEETLLDVEKERSEAPPCALQRRGASAS